MKDAFLTVEQIVEARVKGSNGQSFSWGRVLPGQRDGRLLWYCDLAKHVRQGPLEMKELDAYHSIFKSKHGDCFLMVHVDDLLIVGSRDSVVNKLIPSLQSKYEVSIVK